MSDQAILTRPAPRHALSITAAEAHALHRKAQQCRVEAEVLYGINDQYTENLLTAECGFLQVAEALDEIEAARA